MWSNEEIQREGLSQLKADLSDPSLSEEALLRLLLEDPSHTIVEDACHSESDARTPHSYMQTEINWRVREIIPDLAVHSESQAFPMPLIGGRNIYLRKTSS